MDTIKAIRERRSIRRYTQTQLDPAVLTEILEAGLWAPSAGSRQSPVLAVCQDAETNERLGRINRKAFGKARSSSTSYVSKTQVSIADDDSILSGFYGAPTVITLFAPRGHIYSAADCMAVAQNMSLAAWSLGVGSCYIGRAAETLATPEGQAFAAQCGIEDTLEAQAFLCLGYPDGSPATAKPRREGRIRFFSK